MIFFSWSGLLGWGIKKLTPFIEKKKVVKKIKILRVYIKSGVLQESSEGF